MMFLMTSMVLSLAMAADKPTCSVKAMTRDCAFFKEREDQQKITLADGTYYENPLYKQDSKVASGAAPGGVGMGMSGGMSMGMGIGGYVGADSKEYQATADKALRDQAAILEILDRSGVSTEFKLAYSQSAAFYAASPSTPISLPWPPTQKGAARKTVTGKDLDTFFLQKLGARKSKELKAIVDAQKAPLEQQFLTQQKIQQEQLQKQQKQQEAFALETENKKRRQTRLKELFDYTKDQEVQILTRGKPESQWSDVEKTLVAKIRALELGDFDAAAAAPNCQGNPENAFYRTNGTVNLCPGNLFKPEADVIRTLAHEVGHSVDPCYFQMPQWKTDPVKLNAYMQDPAVTKAQKDALNRILRDGVPIDLDLKLTTDDEALVDDLVAKGVLVKSRDRLTFDKYPFKNEYSCLAGRGGFRENTKKDVADTVSFLKKAAALSDDPKRAQWTIDRYERAMKDYPQCVRSVAHESQMGEVTGDMMGVLVQEKFIAEHPFKNEEEKVGSSMFARSNCTNEEDVKSYAPKTMSSVGFTILADEHPQHASRVEHIALTLPGLAEAYGCKRKGPGCFDHLSLTARKGGSSNSENSATATQGGRK